MNYKPLLSIFFIFFVPAFLLPFIIIAQVKSDDILGVWLTESKKAHVKIEKIDNKFYGKIIWLREPLTSDGKQKTDSKNPDIVKRKAPLMGLKLLRDFVFDDGEWEDGSIYDPESGSDYSCVITLLNSKSIKVRGYIGFSLIGRTQIWTRVP